LLSLKNKYFAIIYSECLKGTSARKIHKALYDATINTKPQYADKFVLGMAIKLSNKAKKVSVPSGGTELLAVALLDLFLKNHSNDKFKKLINHEVMEESEKNKGVIINDYIKTSRDHGKWFYLASSHGDCAEDHKDYQGRLYIDRNAPEEAMNYARSRKLLSLQWVMDGPVYFVTRPNCRHYFVALTEEEVRGKTLKKLKRKYKTHNREGDTHFATPRSEAIKEYTDRLKMLKAMYNEYPTDKLKAEILKTEMLVKKWKER